MLKNCFKSLGILDCFFGRGGGPADILKPETSKSVYQNKKCLTKKMPKSTVVLFFRGVTKSKLVGFGDSWKRQ